MVQGQRNGKCTSPEKKDGVYVVRNDVLVCRCVYREHNSRGGRGCGSVEDGKLPHGTAAVRGGEGTRYAQADHTNQSYHNYIVICVGGSMVLPIS